MLLDCNRQIALADVLIINKLDLVSEAELQAVKEAIWLVITYCYITLRIFKVAYNYETGRTTGVWQFTKLKERTKRTVLSRLRKRVNDGA